MPVAALRSAMEGLSDMTAMSQIVNSRSSPFYHNLCVARLPALSHIVTMESGDKNGGPVTLKAWREHRKMSQAVLAEAVNTNANMIGYLESGERGLTALWMRKLAVPLGVRPGLLIDGLPDEKPAVPSVSELGRMIERAMKELPIGVSFEEYPSAVASNLHAQLTRYQAAGGFRESPDEPTSPGTGAQSQHSTKPDAPGGSRTG